MNTHKHISVYVALPGGGESFANSRLATQGNTRVKPPVFLSIVFFALQKSLAHGSDWWMTCRYQHWIHREQGFMCRLWLGTHSWTALNLKVAMVNFQTFCMALRRRKRRGRKRGRSKEDFQPRGNIQATPLSPMPLFSSSHHPLHALSDSVTCYPWGIQKAPTPLIYQHVVCCLSQHHTSLSTWEQKYGQIDVDVIAAIPHNFYLTLFPSLPFFVLWGVGIACIDCAGMGCAMGQVSATLWEFIHIFVHVFFVFSSLFAMGLNLH